MAEPRELLTIEEAGETLGIRRNLLYNLIMSGELVSIKLGRCRRVPRVEIDRFIARKIEEQKLGAA